MAEAVLTETWGRVLLVTLNRPEAMNAINHDLAEGLLAAIQRLDTDPNLAVGVLTGAGRGFSSGMDLKEFLSGNVPTRFLHFIEEGSPKPLVAAIEGFALAGGLELALGCDLLVAAKGAKLGLPEVRVGMFAAAGGLLRLPQRLPYSVAMEMALTGEPITAEDADRYGLLARLVEPGSALAEAMVLAERIAQGAPLAVAASKRLIRDSQSCSEAEFWALQQARMTIVFSSRDAAEGSRAFAEKRPAAWTGR
jgi:enoyl-CoA hydratase